MYWETVGEYWGRKVRLHPTRWAEVCAPPPRRASPPPREGTGVLEGRGDRPPLDLDAAPFVGGRHADETRIVRRHGAGRGRRSRRALRRRPLAAPTRS